MTEFAIHGSVAVLTMDDGKANVVGHGLLDDLEAALDSAETGAQAIVLAGRAGMFSGGFDLNELKKGPEASAQLVGRGAKFLLRLFKHPQPVVAAATGHGIAAGAFLLLACDTRLGADGAFKYGLNETAIGMSLPVFGIQLASARLAQQHLTAAVTQATIYESLQALEVGYLDQLVAPDALLKTAIAEAARLGEFETQAYRDNKVSWRAPYIAAIEASIK